MGRIIKHILPNQKKFNEIFDYDLKMNAGFHNKEKLSKRSLKSFEMKYLKAFRKCQANKNTIWRKYYAFKLRKISEKTGIGISSNVKIGKGLIIGHYGRIIVNENVVFGDDIMLTHNVTIGRDIRGKRKGTPTIGNRVVIRTNSVITGNITIGDDVLIAPNTFVNFDVPSHSIVIGNPATIHHRDNATEGHIPYIDKKEN